MIGSAPENAAAGLPPGPRRTPWSVGWSILSPAAALGHYAQQFGDPFTDRMIGRPNVITWSPEGARELLTADPDYFEVPQPEIMIPILGQNSLLVLVGERHRSERKLLNPHFHGSRMRAYGNIMRDIALKSMAEWKVSEPFRMLDKTQVISVDVIVRAVFGVDSGHLEEFRAAVIEFVRALSLPIVFFPVLRQEFGGHGPWARFVRARTKLCTMLDAAMDAESARQASTGEVRQDILSLLVSARYDNGQPLERQHLRDELITLLFAGHETTAVSLAWMFYDLHRSPAALARLRSEIAALGPDPDPDAVAQLPYLTAVCNESMRLHTILPISAPRQIRKPFPFMGYTLQPGTLATIALTRLHKREDLYPEPLSFRPERFLGRTFSPFEFAPFGGSVRRCIGAAFALYEMKIVLATVLSRCRLSLVSNAPIREMPRNAVVGPSDGVRMLVTSHQS